MILYTYFRSSASYRARIALHLKGIPFESRFVHLLRQGGQQLQPDYRRLNPLGRVPTLIDGAQVVTQSVAIMEYLEEAYPAPHIMPTDAAHRALVRAITQTIAADIQPMQNLSTTRYMSAELHQPQEAINAWTRHWMSNGLRAVEDLLAASDTSGNFSCGEFPSIADICIVAQCYSSRRLQVPVESFARVARIDAHCRELPAFRAAAPENQADFEA